MKTFEGVLVEKGWQKGKSERKVAVSPQGKFAFHNNARAYYKGGSHADSTRLRIWSSKP